MLQQIALASRREGDLRTYIPKPRVDEGLCESLRAAEMEILCNWYNNGNFRSNQL